MRRLILGPISECEGGGPVLALGRDRFGNQNMKLSRHQHPPIVPIHRQRHNAEIIIFSLEIR